MRTRWIGIGTMILGWIIWVSSAWAQSPPPQPPPAQQVDDLTIRLTTDSELGDQGVIVQVTSAEGGPLVTGTVQLEPIMRDMVMNTTPVPLIQAMPGRYDGRVSFNMEGRWDLQVTVIRPGRPDAQAIFPLTAVRGTPLPPRPATIAIPPPFFTRWSVIGINGLLVAAVLAAINRWGLARPRRWYRWISLSLAGLSLVLAIVPYSVARATMPPVVTADAAREQGQALFQTNCVPCHGAAGKGDGPAGRTLRPRPADLTADHVAVHPDSQIYSWIQGGVPGSAMPAFSQLSSDQIWWLVDTVRALRAPSAPTPTP